MSVTLLGALHSTWTKYNNNNDLSDWTWYRILWFILTATSTLYTFYWDIKMDWKLFPFNKLSYKIKNNNKILGRIIEYPIYWYYIAIIMDLILRYTWTFTLMPTVVNPYFTNNSIITSDTFMFIIEILV